MNRAVREKRKAPIGGGFNRRVRARKQEPEPEQYDSNSQSENDNVSDDDEDGPVEMKSSRKAALEQYSDSEDQDSDSQDQEDGDDISENSDDDEPDLPSVAASQISFGALAKVQAELPNARKKKSKDSENKSPASDDDDEAPEEQRTSSHREEESRSRRAPIPSRAHKHAPTEQSSKRAVTRKREVIGQTVVRARDPRFDSIGDDMDNDRLRKRYSFLEKYRDDELATMKRTLKDATMAAKGGGTKAQKKKLRDAPRLSEHEREKLKREIVSIESRKASQAAKDRHKELLDEHRKKEKELVKQGKTPYYLKKADQKKQVLVDRFAGMKKGQVDRAIERKRKKVVAKERRDMPWARRSAME